jgi:hypothetical protein
MKPNFASVIQSLNFIQIKKQVIRFFLNVLTVTTRARATGTVNDQTKRRARSSLFSKYFSIISSQASTGKINACHSGTLQSVPQGPAAGVARDQTTPSPEPVKVLHSYIQTTKINFILVSRKLT